MNNSHDNPVKFDKDFSQFDKSTVQKIVDGETFERGILQPSTGPIPNNELRQHPYSAILHKNSQPNPNNPFTTTGNSLTQQTSHPNTDNPDNNIPPLNTHNNDWNHSDPTNDDSDLYELLATLDEEHNSNTHSTEYDSQNIFEHNHRDSEHNSEDTKHNSGNTQYDNGSSSGAIGNSDQNTQNKTNDNSIANHENLLQPKEENSDEETEFTAEYVTEQLEAEKFLRKRLTRKPRLHNSLLTRVNRPADRISVTYSNGLVLGKAIYPELENRTNIKKPLEKWKNIEGEYDYRWRWDGDTGVMSHAERDFYKRASTSYREVRQGLTNIDWLRSPVLEETKTERQARIDKLSAIVFGEDHLRRRFTWQQKHNDTLIFLSKFRHVSTRIISHLFNETEQTTKARLATMRDRGLVYNKEIWSPAGNTDLWYATKTGTWLMGYDLDSASSKTLNYTVLPHYFVIAHHAAMLINGTLNVLNEKNFPQHNRIDNEGNPTQGEQLVAEVEIRSSFAKQQGWGQKKEEYSPRLRAQIRREFREWMEAGGLNFGPSPEFYHGNEWMWALLPDRENNLYNLSFHMPDLVVKRERNPDGSPNSIAIEVELGQKGQDSIARTLDAYAEDKIIYKQVIWVVQNRSVAKNILKADENGPNLVRNGRMKILPIYTKDGILKNNQVWTI